jgi:prolipoprotein diacylglyceryltransferase
MGLATLACAIAGLAGARVYHLLVFRRRYRRRAPSAWWDSTRGGWSVFGALPPLALVAWGLAGALAVEPAVFADLLAGGVLAGGAWVRLGCVLNGCCGGRETDRWYGVRLHDVHGTKRRCVPVPLVEVGFWLLGAAAYAATLSLPLDPGTRALAVLLAYGVLRLVLEPLRETPDLVGRRLRVNRLVAGLLAATSAAALLLA